jgi:glycosyltransferase involved in cell wall biosynthesis
MSRLTASGRGRTPAVEFSAVITCYFEENSIEEFHRRLSDAFAEIGRPYEVIFVNDGSKDGTWEKLSGIFAADPNVHAILDLFKNFGQQAAITAGLAEARGTAVVLMDSDLQLSPEELPRLVAEYDRGFDLVTGYRVNRKDSLFRIVPSWLANVIMRRASHSSVRDFGCTFKIYNANLLRAFQYGPGHLFSNVEAISRIDRIAEVPVSHKARKYGKSGWTFSKLLKYNMENLVVISERPFQISGFLCLLAAVLFVVRLLVDYFLPFRILPSVTTGLILNAVVISLLVTIGILSLIGEFAIRSFLAARRVPAYIVRETIKRETAADETHADTWEVRGTAATERLL